MDPAIDRLVNQHRGEGVRIASDSKVKKFSKDRLVR
jgi:hypothetical protein